VLAGRDEEERGEQPKNGGHDGYGSDDQESHVPVIGRLATRLEWCRTTC
jgi:hypothetical protein